MNDHWSPALAEPAVPSRGIEFTGNWREYLPIALSNALLTIVTLGIYRYWAAARQRRYLWSRTLVIDDTLEWTGTGKEMFVGFLVVMAVMLPFFLFFQFAFPALVARGQGVAAGGVMLLFFVGLVYIGGLARFRALRYRLSRTWWRGIRGGSDEPGWRYAGGYLGRMALAAITLWIAFPWAAVRLWNDRWNKMSFGSHPFVARLTTDGLKGRWAALYLVPPAMLLLIGLLAFLAVGGADRTAADARVGIFGMVGLVVGVIYFGIPLLTLHWYAKYYRRAADSLSIAGLEFSFEGTTWGWLKLFLGNLALAVVTLGFGLTYWGYRNWAFIVRNLRIHGEILVDETRQSTASAPGEAEGFADAFDLGAI